MNIKHTIFISFICIFIVVVSNTAIAKKRPNIVIMMTDDQGYGDIGMHGNPYLKTPNIERIAQEGLEMTTFLT